MAGTSTFNYFHSITLTDYICFYLILISYVTLHNLEIVILSSEGLKVYSIFLSGLKGETEGLQQEKEVSIYDIFLRTFKN